MKSLEFDRTSGNLLNSLNRCFANPGVKPAGPKHGNAYGREQCNQNHERQQGSPDPANPASFAFWMLRFLHCFPEPFVVDSVAGTISIFSRLRLSVSHSSALAEISFCTRSSWICARTESSGGTFSP